MEWTILFQIGGLVGGIATILAFFLAPTIYLAGKIDSLRAEMSAEMKDFHGRLCAIEERNKKE